MYHHVDTIPILRILWMISFESVWFACFSVWLHVALVCVSIFSGCRCVDEVSGVSCGAGNLPHSHFSARVEVSYVFLSSLVAFCLGVDALSVPLCLSVILESLFVNRWLLIGPRYFFVRTLGI